MTVGDLESTKRTNLLKNKAIELGFTSCRISKAGFLENEAPKLEQWLKEERNGKMAYMGNHFDKRLDPRLLVEGSKSVITLVYNYFPENDNLSKGEFKISRYAYGEDYHLVLKEKLTELLSRLREEIGNIEGRVFVDSAPVLEKAWAAKNGTGWLGKNTNIIHPKLGSYFFLCELILDLELIEDTPINDHCGTCTRCIDACPTNAITGPYRLDAKKCISYLTIELKESIPIQFKNQMENWVFGCDICQEVCPWNNKFSITHTEKKFEPHPDLLLFERKEWMDLTEEVFKKVFSNSAIKRTKLEGLKRNIQFLNENETAV